jgi:hypothetical protein
MNGYIFCTSNIYTHILGYGFHDEGIYECGILQVAPLYPIVDSLHLQTKQKRLITPQYISLST